MNGRVGEGAITIGGIKVLDKSAESIELWRGGIPEYTD